MKPVQERHDDEAPESEPRRVGRSNHPTQEELQRFMTGELASPETRAVVRHLLSGCPTCTRETRRLWSFGEERPLAVPIRTTRQPRQGEVWQ